METIKATTIELEKTDPENASQIVVLPEHFEDNGKYQWNHKIHTLNHKEFCVARRRTIGIQ